VHIGDFKVSKFQPSLTQVYVLNLVCLVGFLQKLEIKARNSTLLYCSAFSQCCPWERNANGMHGTVDLKCAYHALLFVILRHIAGIL